MSLDPIIRARSRRGVTLIGVAAIAWVVGCEPDCVTCVDLRGELPLILSDTAAQASDPAPDLSRSREAGRSSLLATSGTEAATNVAYVSLSPGAVPNGLTTSIRNRVTGSAITVPMVDGGFDPVAMGATAGDLLEFEIQVAGGSGPLLFTSVVPGRRLPKVVRTNPPPKKRDVALNSSIIIVFSEPLDAETLTDASVQLLLGTTAVPGRLQFRDADHLTAAFIPLAPLTAGKDYRLVVTQTIRDRDGEALEAPVSVEFRTRDAPGPSASVVRVPEDATTIQEGVDFVQAGGVVRVNPGPYAEAIEINKGVTIEASTETDAVVIAPPSGTVNAITITTTEPVILRRLTIDHLGLASGTYDDGGTMAIFGTGRANLTIVESNILRANVGVYIENDSAVTGGRAHLIVRNSAIDGGETPGMETGVFAITDVDAVIAENTVRRTTFSCLQIQGTANAEVIGNDIDTCGRFGGIRAMMATAAQTVNIIGNTVRNSAGSDSRFGIIRSGGTGVIERNSIVDYVRSTADGSLAAAIALRSDATATLRFNDISGNTYAGLRNETSSTIDATCNWWGQADGPSGAGGGRGDSVIGAVTFAPFATAPIARSSETLCSGYPGGATRLAFAVQPTNTVAGRSIAPTVRVNVQDTFGNTALGFSGPVTVTLAANPGASTLRGTTTVTAVDGVATFPNLILDKVGSGYLLMASAFGLTPTTSVAFDVTAQSADVAYFNDFETAVGPEWSNTTRSTVPNQSRPGPNFLGEFGCTDYGLYDYPTARQADECHASDLVTLTLSALPTHDEVTISFDLYVIQSWDGNPGPDAEGQSICGWETDSPRDLCAPDLFHVSVVGGPTLLNATFAVHSARPYQSYPAQYPTDESPPTNNTRHSGALEINALGFGGDGDAVYRFTFTFPHAEPSITFKFTAPKLQPLYDESWGLDNVEVRVGRRP